MWLLGGVGLREASSHKVLPHLGLDDGPQMGPLEEPHWSSGAPRVFEPGVDGLFTVRVGEERAPWPRVLVSPWGVSGDSRWSGLGLMGPFVRGSLEPK